MRERITLWLAKKIAVIVIKWRGNLLNYQKAVRKAERLAKGTSSRRGKRTYIYFIGGRYRCLNRKQVQYWRNHTKGVRPDLTVTGMRGVQLYDTMGHINSHPTYRVLDIPGINILYKRQSCTSPKQN